MKATEHEVDVAALAPPPEAAREVVDTLHGAGHEAWLVGGCVRDRVLGRAVNDWDVATDAEPLAVMALFPKAIGTGLQHGTVTVVHGGLPIEVTTYRVEIGYSDGRRPDEVRFTRELEADLSRRDFTINAMAWDPANHTIRDPFGGVADLRGRCVRAVGLAAERFGEDGLRAMRAVRFAAVLGFDLEAETEAAIPRAMATFRKVAVERVRVELAKLLLSDRPGWGVRALRATALLPEFLPEVSALEDAAFDATCAALDASPDEIAVRLAVLLRATPDEGGALRRLRFSNGEIKAASALLALRSVETAPVVGHAPALRALVARVGAAAWPDWLAMRRAWADEGEAERLDALDALERSLDARNGPLVPKDLALDGRQVAEALGLRPSRRIGQLLDAALRRVWQTPALNTPEALRAVLPELNASLETP